MNLFRLECVMSSIDKLATNNAVFLGTIRHQFDSKIMLEILNLIIIRHLASLFTAVLQLEETNRVYCKGSLIVHS